jgi:hypothetical protein
VGQAKVLKSTEVGATVFSSCSLAIEHLKAWQAAGISPPPPPMQPGENIPHFPQNLTAKMRRLSQAAKL